MGEGSRAKELNAEGAENAERKEGKINIKECPFLI
jgi:hypothetical protein